MNPESPSPKYRTVKSFFEGARPTLFGKNVKDQIVLEQAEMIVDKGQLRVQSDWSFLANKIVGA
jgi:hypothetical protein